MAATLVQETTAHEDDSSTDGVTFTLGSTPTSGNLLVLCHGLRNNTSSTGLESISSGFTHRIVVGDGAGWHVTMNILDRVADGTEGTSIVVTHTGGAGASNGGWIGEYSGMTASPFISGSVGDSGDSYTSVTSRVSGDSDTGTVDNALVVAAWGQSYDAATTGDAASNSFTIEGIEESAAGPPDIRSVVATRSITTAGTYNSTLSWTTSTPCNACIAAYQISVTSVLQAIASDGVTVGEVVEAFPTRLFIATSESVTIAEMVIASSGSGSGTATMLITGTEGDINTTLMSLEYKSDSGYTGADVLTVISTNATSNVDTDTVAITVIAAPAGAPEDVETLAPAPVHRRRVT